MTLLEKAKKISVKKIGRYGEVNKDQIELILAWLKDEINSVQFSKVLHLKSKGGNYLYYVAAMLKRAYKRGLIKIEMI